MTRFTMSIVLAFYVTSWFTAESTFLNREQYYDRSSSSGNFLSGLGGFQSQNNGQRLYQSNAAPGSTSGAYYPGSGGYNSGNSGYFNSRRPSTGSYSNYQRGYSGSNSGGSYPNYPSSQMFSGYGSRNRGHGYYQNNNNNYPTSYPLSMGGSRGRGGYHYGGSRHNYPNAGPQRGPGRVVIQPLSGLPSRSSNHPTAYNWFDSLYYDIRSDTANRAVYDTQQALGRGGGWNYISDAASTGRITSYINSDRVANMAIRRLDGEPRWRY